MKWPGLDIKTALFIYYILQIAHSKSIKWLLNWNTFQVFIFSVLQELLLLFLLI